ncbi:MAG: HEAT repeat domain-containing protein [Planctomyces sp.]
MKWSWMFSAAVALSGMTGTVEAGLFGNGGCKSCGCAEDCQPAVCKPTIARPCHTNVYTYQRKCSDIKPPCCDDGCGSDSGCAPVSCGAPAGVGCAAPAGCAPDPNCAAPAGAGCAAPAGCAADPSCAAPAGDGCGTECGEGCSAEDACEIAKLIYTSMTDCYATKRRNALDELGDYDCSCHPEIINAFVYGLNDTDERVRREAADELGDAARSKSCCCSPAVVSALTCALADCDRGVRRQAEEALEACGYEIVDGNCDGCTEGCVDGSCGHHHAAPVEAPAAAAPEAAPAPAPPAEPQAFFPSRLHNKSQSRSGLAGLFGMK